MHISPFYLPSKSHPIQSSPCPPGFCHSPPHSTGHLGPLRPNITCRTHIVRSKNLPRLLLACKKCTLVLREQALPAARARPHLKLGTRRDSRGLPAAEGHPDLSHHHPFPCPRDACTPEPSRTPVGMHGEGFAGRDRAAKQQHLPQTHPAYSRRQRLLRDVPLIHHRHSFFSSRSYCAPWSRLGSSARLILPGTHPLWTWENNVSP